MSTVKKDEYYTNNSLINMHIDNIISFRDFLNAILNDIKSGEYNTQMIKNLSQTVEKFYNEIGDEDMFKSSTENQNEKRQFIPRQIETFTYSDTDDDADAESDITVMSGVDSDTPPRESYSISKFFSHNPSSIYNDDPEFLDDASPTETSLPNNAPQNTSVISSYSELREKKVCQYDYYQSLYDLYKQEANEEQKKYNDDKENSSLTPINFVKTDVEPVIPPETKPIDKLAHAFLNNNLELDKYHYLKNINQNRVENFCVMSYIY